MMNLVHLQDVSEENEIDFDQTIQEFGAQVGIICALESGQKIGPKEAYKQIKSLFKQLKTAKRTVYPKNEAS
ncbi:MAG: hypothetical protein OXC40_01280 [Proteobacteria bacterium]|nr:hypothetical protein [Pseudomonadota bacterium]